MKNITVTVEDELYHSARVIAAKRKTNVTALVRGYLAALVDGRAPESPAEPQDADAKQRANLVRLFEGAKLDLGYRPSRRRTYDR